MYHLDPIIPAELKLLAINETVMVLVKHREHLFESLLWHDINVSLVVAEQCPTDERKLGQGQLIIAEKKQHLVFETEADKARKHRIAHNKNRSVLAQPKLFFR